MPSAVQICNMALSHIGSEASVASISPPDGSVEAGHCATFYDLARTELLEPGSWAFSLKRAPLAAISNPGSAWAHAYAKPADCQRPLRVLRQNVAVTVFTQVGVDLCSSDRDGAPFDIEGELILTNEPDAVLVYVCDVTDTTRFPASFTGAFSYLLASYLAGPIIKGNEGMRVGDAMRARAISMADLSATASANASSAELLPQPTMMAVRA